MRRRLFLLLVLFFCTVPTLRAADVPATWLLVTAPAFRDAVEPLCEQRKAEGLRVVVVQTSDVLSAQEIRAGDSRKLRDKVTELCKDAKGDRYVLLVGAVEPAGLDEPEKKVLPPLKGTVSRMKGQPTDHGFGAPGEDFLATAAVGRLPARSVEEAKQMIARTLAFERDRRPGEWRRRLTILAGAPEFNPFVDGLVEKVALARLDQLDPAWSGKAVFHMAASRFCLPDDVIHDRSLEYVQAGQALTLYLGHSNAQGFWAGRRALPRPRGLAETVDRARPRRLRDVRLSRLSVDRQRRRGLRRRRHSQSTRPSRRDWLARGLLRGDGPPGG